MRMVMKMAAVSTISLLLLCCSTISSTDSQEVCDHYAATGENLTVPLLQTLEASDLLRWRHNEKTIFYRKQGTFVLGSKEDASENGSLKLTNMEKIKAGTYTPEVHDKDGQVKGKLRSIHLCVQDRVLKPSVTTQCMSTFVRFTCRNNQAKDLKIEWLQNGKSLDMENGQTLTRKPQDVGTDSFICKVSNYVSSLSSSPVTQTCWSPSVKFPKTVFGINTWILVGVGGGIVLVLIVSVIVCCICAKRKKRTQLKDEGELRLAWTNDHPHEHNPPPDHHHHHHHHHHRQQQPVGHTGPRQQRSKPHREQQRPRVPDHGNGTGLPQPSPRRPGQAPRPVDQINDEQPPPLPQPRKKAAKTPRV